MDCVEAKALKTSFWPEMTVKSNQQVVFEDLWGGNGTNNGVSGDETFVDDLLNFSNEDVEERVVRKEGNEDEQKGFLSVSSFQEQKPLLSSGASIKNDFASVFASELSVPTEDLADLEWLSHFVEDSFSEDISLQYLDGKPTEKPQTGNSQKLSEPEPETPSLKPVGFPKRVPAKARSKRSRTGGRVWSLGSSPFTETSSSSSSSSSSTSSSSSCLIFNSAGQNLEFFDYLGKPPKKPKLKRQVNGGGTLVQRRCSHCGVQKTPQWRTGPLGAKTLCNACGVRYKSGRLLPEYRPAGSPTFLSDVHSNSHRKVLEMRRKKETAPPEPGLATAVHSF